MDEQEQDDEDINTLIGELSDDLKPIKGVMSPFRMISPWIIVALAYVAGVIHFLGVRMDWQDKLHEAPFIFELGLTAAIVISAAYVAGWLAVPDMREKKWLLAIPTTLFGVFLLWTASMIIAEGFIFPDMSWHECFSDALLMAFVPIASLSVLVRKGATTHPLWLAFMSVLSVGALGWGSLRLTCSADDSGHTLFFHFMPFILLAVGIGALARRLYRW